MNREQYEQVKREVEETGEPAVKVCKSMGFVPQSYYTWRSKLGESNPTPPRKKSAVTTRQPTRAVATHTVHTVHAVTPPQTSTRVAMIYGSPEQIAQIMAALP